MNVYLDASALLKQYFQEPEAQDVADYLDAAYVVATSGVTRAEIAATLARQAERLPPRDPEQVYQAFRLDWQDLIRIEVRDDTLQFAEELGWNCHFLAGIDTIHLASALWFQETIGEDVVMATFDYEVWIASHAMGLRVWPTGLCELGPPRPAAVPSPEELARLIEQLQRRLDGARRRWQELGYG